MPWASSVRSFFGAKARPGEAPGGLRRFVSYVLVGVLNTVFAYLVFCLLLYLGLHYSLASLGALVLGILFSFQTTGRLVFGSTDQRLILRYVLGWALVYGLTVACLAGFDAAGFNLYLGNALLIPVTTVLSYLINLKFVFVRGGARSPGEEVR